MEAVLDTLRFAFGPVRYAKAKWSGKGSCSSGSSDGGPGEGTSTSTRGSNLRRQRSAEEEGFEEKPLYVKACGYFSHIFLIIVSYVREALFGAGPLDGRAQYGERHREGYAPLLDSFETFYIRYVLGTRLAKDNHVRPA